MSSHPLIRPDFSLREKNTFGIDAKAQAYLQVRSVADLEFARSDKTLSGLQRLVLGGGSNILLTRDFDGLVLHMCNDGMQVIGEDDDVTWVRAAAGERWHDFVQWTLKQNLAGLENLSLIPGSAGAAPIQNIGAYGAELRDYFHALSAFDFETGEIFFLNQSECEFAYRDSVFKHRLRDRAIILDVTFALPKRWQPNLRYAELAQAVDALRSDPPTARQISDAVINIRRRKLPDPASIGNAGSFFKNPVVSVAQRAALLTAYPQLISYVQADGSYKLAAGWLIDQCGWKGRTVGHAGVYEMQALVLVNRGGASGAEIAQLAAAIQSDVRQRFGVMLEPEPVFV